MTSVSQLLTTPRGVIIEWEGQGSTEFVWRWLQDHAHDARTYDQRTAQRMIPATALQAGATGVVRVEGDDLVVEWAADIDTTRVPLSFMADIAARGCDHVGEPQDAEHATTLWDRDTIERGWPTVAYEEVINDDRALARWLGLIHRYGFAFATGTPASMEATQRLLERVGYVRETIFGGMWDFQADMAMADTAFTNLELLPHTDGTYSHDAPGLQMLHCLVFDGTGGESTMVDGFAAAERLRGESEEHYRTLSTVRVPGQYVGDGSHLIAHRPPLRHEGGRVVQVSFNNADRAPFLLPPDEMNSFYDAIDHFETIVNDPAMQWRKVIRPGDAMLFDNWRVLHGRCAYTGLRRLCGGYVNREDFESRRRVTSR
jgi:trimethyllysine dioxygenase